MRLFSEFGPDHIQGASCFEPFDLWFIVGMVEGDFVFAAVLMVQDHGQGFAGSERAEACDIDAVVLLYFVVIFFAREGQGQHALFLQVGLVDTGEAPHDDGPYAAVAGFHGGMFAVGAFSVILVAYHYGADAGCLVSSCRSRYRSVLACQLVPDGVRFLVVEVDGADEHIVGNIIQVAAEFEPGACHGDMVGRTFSFGFDQQFEPFQVDAFPGGEGGQELEALAVRLDGYLYAWSGFGWGVGARVFEGEGFGGQVHAGGFIEHDVFSLLVLQGIFQGVEGQGACDGEGGDDLRGSHESMGACQSVVAFGKVPVEGGDDGVLTVGIVDMTGPLPDTGSAGIGQHDAADLVESLQKAVFFNGIAYQLRSGGNGEFRFCLQVLVDSLLGQGGGTADIFVRRVGTGADQGYFEAFGPVVGFYGFCEFADGPGQIGGERSINMGFQFIQVDLDHLVVVFFGIAVYFFIGTEVVFDAIRQGGYFFPACAFQVSRHFFVIGE